MIQNIFKVYVNSFQVLNLGLNVGCYKIKCNFKQAYFFYNKNMFKWEKILAAIKQQMLSVLLELFKNASVL